MFCAGLGPLPRPSCPKFDPADRTFAGGDWARSPFRPCQACRQLAWLARPASEIRVVEILAAVDETVDAMHKGAGASGGSSGSRAQSLTNRLWEGLSAHVYVFLHQTRLSDVIKNDLAPCPAVPSLFSVVDE